MQKGKIEYVNGVATVFAGESATRLFQVKAVITALRFEMKTGLRINRRGALPVAKKLTGSKTNKREKQIELLERLATELEKNVTVVQQ